MEQVSFVLRIRPERYGEYVKRHKAVYPELEEGFTAAGIHHYRIYYHEGTWFATMTVTDYSGAMQDLETHPANVRWQPFMSDLLLPWEDETKVKLISEVYRFPRS
ncbi:L-rhamnose mutarotase [Paenibacillus sp. y28]|uniref:L-rhamnose mutarotase n=1 Tax=Paenibacillus sp. y28 TaxID=3129110 RepID=UPI00301AC242